MTKRACRPRPPERFHAGQVLARSWIKPLEPVPPELKALLGVLNVHPDHDVVLLAGEDDIAEKGFIVQTGTHVRFKYRVDDGGGVVACDVSSMELLSATASATVLDTVFSDGV